MKNIIWKNIPGINGYGDALNRLSYLYRSNEDIIVKCSFHDKIENWKKVNFVRKNVLVRNPNFRMNCTQGRFFERLSVKYRITPWYLNPKHDYWPARVMHNKKSTGNIGVRSSIVPINARLPKRGLPLKPLGAIYSLPGVIVPIR